MIIQLQRKLYITCWAAAVFALSFSAGCSSETNSSKTISPPMRDLLMSAEKAIAAGDSEQAIADLNAIIAEKPIPWAYAQRSRLLAKAGDDEAAQSDVKAGLELAPENRDLKWISNELRKPAAKRFQGANARPPSSKK